LFYPAAIHQQECGARILGTQTVPCNSAPAGVIPWTVLHRIGGTVAMNVIIAPLG